MIGTKNSFPPIRLAGKSLRIPLRSTKAMAIFSSFQMFPSESWASLNPYFSPHTMSEVNPDKAGTLIGFPLATPSILLATALQMDNASALTEADAL